jgi:hypothetical protein
MIDHERARELVDLAAAEPGELDRLTAGETPTSRLLADHLAACPACQEHLDRTRRLSQILRGVLAEVPGDDLRERTMAAVTALGVRRRPSVVPWRVRWLAVAAAAVLLLGGGVAAIKPSLDAAGELRQTVGELVAAAQSRDAHWVALAAADPAGGAVGSLVYAPSTGRLVVVAVGLPAAPPGGEYRCWVEAAGRRTVVGRMHLSGDVAYWSGPVGTALAAQPLRFGVSLVANGTTSEVLVGGG